MKPLDEFAREKNVFLAAHRGASGTVQENTIEAYEMAIKEGAAMVETDIRLSTDGVPFTFHDDSTIVNGQEFNLSANSYERIKKAIGHAPPTLDEIIKTIKDRAYLMIEIKSDFSESAPKRSRMIVETVEKHKYLDHTLFGSFDYNILRELKNHYPTLNTAAIRIPGDTSQVSSLKEKLGIKAFVCSAEECDKDLMDDTQNAGILVGVYGINDKESYERISALGVKCIVTDYPGRIKELMG